MRSSYFTAKPVDGGKEVFNLGNNIYRGQVLRVIYPDDKDNVSKLFVEYDIMVEFAKGGVSKVKNAPKLNSLGGTNDFDETVLEPSEVAFSGKNDSTNIFKNRNGTIVAVAFLNGNFERPVIIGTFSHPKKSQRTKADGISHVSVFRGLKTEISSLGELTITYQSESSPDGKAKRPETTSVIKIDKNGTISFDSHKGGVTQVLDGKNKKYQLKTGEASMELDANAKKVVGKAGDVSVELDGSGKKATLKAGSVTIEVDSANKVTVTAGSSKIIVDGAGGKIQLDGNLVDVGQGASALAVLGPQLVAWLSSHTHMEQGDGAPTSPPLVPPPASLLSNSVKVKS